ncbi:MAG: response regulator transcription factor [Lachnospiraceae bacterium]|jgi:two-component system OmpR family response regulator|nr:response regulator transcription factor [Lachnospiraceae bacterium]
MNKILLIDDDKELCTLIKKSVLQENIAADCCYLGRDGLRKLKEKAWKNISGG